MVLAKRGWRNITGAKKSMDMHPPKKIVIFWRSQKITKARPDSATVLALSISRSVRLSSLFYLSATRHTMIILLVLTIQRIVRYISL